MAGSKSTLMEYYQANLENGGAIRDLLGNILIARGLALTDLSIPLAEITGARYGVKFMVMGMEIDAKRIWLERDSSCAISCMKATRRQITWLV